MSATVPPPQRLALLARPTRAGLVSVTDHRIVKDRWDPIASSGPTI